MPGLQSRSKLRAEGARKKIRGTAEQNEGRKLDRRSKLIVKTSRVCRIAKKGQEIEDEGC
jgi:hypothetical protein